MNLNNKDKLKLWYNKPAGEWLEALPLGNGRLGAMVYGDPLNENIQINEETVWSTGENNNINPQAKELIQKIQKCIFEGNLKDADLLAKEAYNGNFQGSYQTLGNILLNFRYPENKETVRTYRRELDLETAISMVRYSVGGVNYRQESFISAVDNVFAMSMKATDIYSINLEAALTRPQNCNLSIGKLPLSLVMKGRCGDESSVQYCAMLKILPRFDSWDNRGTADCVDGKLIIKDASNLLIYLAAATDFNNSDPEETCIKLIQKAEEKGFESIKTAHINEYQKLFKRMDLSLGEDKLYDFVPTDERLMRISDGDIDNSLVALYYQYGRYLLISSSRRDCELPSNLQGIWNNLTYAPWGSRYTININTQMNYWVAEQCNLSECHEPLFRLIEKLKVKGRIMARDMYGCKGFMAHHNTNIWGDASPQDNWCSSTYWPMGAAWLCHHLWDRYEYTMDKDFLLKAYPTMKEACEFFVDFLVEDSQGRLVTCPSLSPENMYRNENGHTTAICAGPTMDNSILRKLFSIVIEAADILGIDGEFSDKLSAIKNRLAELKIGKNGTIMEWLEDYEETDLGHRHISHLFALHPAGEITIEGTPELAEAARKTLERRLSHGGGHTGWSCAWIINMWARLWDAENAHKYVQMILAKSTYPNMLDAHPPFQIDGNFGATAGITEMLLQSNKGVLNLLPALSKQWKDGYVKGIRGRGNYVIDMEWSNGQLTKAIISTCIPTTQITDCMNTNNIKIKYRNINSYIVKCNDNVVPFTTLDNSVIAFEAESGKQYIIEGK